MRYRSSTVAFALAALITTTGGARADDAKYPDWSGQWTVILTPGLAGQRVKFDPTKPWGPAQQAPLTQEYQKVLQESMADQANGGIGNYPSATCRAGGMPRMMSVGQFEYVVTPETTYVLIGGEDHYRRIFTDGRDWPAAIEPTYQGYSIGKWVDDDGDGRYDALEVETRGFKGPRIFDPTGIPLHEDNGTVIKERFRLVADGAVEDEITTIDSALTKPWTVTRKFKRQPRAAWAEYVCQE